MKITTKCILWVILLLVSFYFSACATTDQSIQQTTGTHSFILKSPAFLHKGTMPYKYSLRGENISPPLIWENPPKGTKSYVITVEDPDAVVSGKMLTWVHWIIYNIPADQTSLPEGVPKKKILANGAQQAKTDFNDFGYDGPDPGDNTHRYIFTITALDVEKIDKPRRKILKQHALGKATLTGLYK
jgi:Raf kinase inhibitor-like YbhB/YbcL family protein